MSSVRPLSKAILLAGATALTLAALAPASAMAWPFGKKDDPVVIPPVPLAPPPAAAVGLSDQVLSDAAAFRAYTKHAEQLNAAFTSGAGVEQALAVGSAYESQQLARGAIAYAALLALQNPDFVEGVRTYAHDADQRRDLAQRLAADPRYVIVFPGVANAAGLVVATMGVESGRITDVAARVKQSAYSVQHSAWSKTKVIDPAGRLAQTKALSSAIMNGEAGDMDQLKTAMNGGSDASAAQVLAVRGAPVAGPYAPVVQRGLALAALAVLGEANDDNAEAVQAIETEPTGGACLHLAKLNLYQCLAVAVPWYEDIFCLGEHALGETAQCISKDAASPAQIQQAEAVPSASAAISATAVAAPVAVSIPVASMGAPGAR